MQATPTVGVTHDMVMNGVGFMTVGIPTRSDVTSAIPRVSIGTEQRRATDLSELDTFGQNSWHHGRGQVETFDDPNAFNESEGFITWIPNVLIGQLQILDAAKTGGSVTDFDGYASSIIPFQGNLYKLIFGTAAAGNALYIFDNVNTEWDDVAATLDTSSGEPRQLHAFDEELYVAQGETVTARHFDGTSTWTDLGVPAKFFATFGNNDTNFLWRVDNLNQLYFSSDPENDATAFWNGPILVGDTTYPIRGLVAGFQGALWVGKDDGLYAVTFDNVIADFVVQKVIDLSKVLDSNNGVAIIEFGGNLFFSVGHTLYRYDGSTVQIMGPDRGQPDVLEGNVGFPVRSEDTFQSGALGKIVMLAHDENFLYAAIDSNGGQESRVMVWGGTGWHTLFRTTDAGTDRIQSVFSTSALATTNELRFPIIWWSNSSGEKTEYQKQSRFSSDPRDDSGLNYQGAKDNLLVTSWFDAGLPQISKTFIEVLVTYHAPRTSDQLQVEFQTDDDPVWHIVDAMEEMPITGTIKMRLPDNPSVDVQDIGLSARKIRFRFDFFVADTDLGEDRFMLSWATRFVVRPVSRYGWSLTVKAYDNIQLLDQSTEQISAQEIRDQLYQMRDSLIPIKFDDGTSLPAAFNSCRAPSFEPPISLSDLTIGQGWFTINSPTTFLTGQYKVFGAFGQGLDVTTDDSVDRGITNSTLNNAADGSIVKAYIYAYLPIGSDTFWMQIHDGSSVLVERALTPLPDTDGRRFVRYSLSTTISGSAVFPKIRIIRKTGENTTSKTTIYLDGGEIYHTDEAGGDSSINQAWLTSESIEQPLYIDGDQPRCFWFAQEDFNGSARQEGYFVYITGISEAFRYEETRPSTGKRVVNSEITISLREVQ